MTTAEKSEAILKKMLELANKENGPEKNMVALACDWGGNSATIIAEGGHTHVGDPDGTWEQLVDGLYNSLHGGPGLSWARSEPATT